MATTPGPLTYVTSAAFINDTGFRGRVKIACITLAEQIMAEPSTTAGHNSRVRWALQVFQNPDGMASQVAQLAVLDTNVQAQGSAATDAQIQTAVQNAVPNLI